MTSTKDQIIAEMNKGEKSTYEIAKKFAIPHHVLRGVLVDWGVTIKRRSHPRISAPDKKMLIQLIRQHKNCSAVAKIFGVSNYTVTQWYKEAGVPVRSAHGTSKEQWAKFLSEN